MPPTLHSNPTDLNSGKGTGFLHDNISSTSMGAASSMEGSGDQPTHKTAPIPHLKSVPMVEVKQIGYKPNNPNFAHQVFDRLPQPKNGSNKAQLMPHGASTSLDNSSNSYANAFKNSMYGNKHKAINHELSEDLIIEENQTALPTFFEGYDCSNMDNFHPVTTTKVNQVSFLKERTSNGI
ncbi:hypothetical protein LIER_12868 [Lithospermum erythrorhizon]|uniref:Uncharacterized protein n=1 Tax=Lithospermum erythrorhizon TaxID=34254 RepID=A0AAV3PXH3_LITER